MSDIMERKTWLKDQNDTPKEHAKKHDLLKQHYMSNRKSHGSCFMVKFGEDDIRPMYEDQINVATLRNEIRNPVGMTWDCPLCQPYDSWGGLMEVDRNRRFMCKIVQPKYVRGAIDEDGVHSKCVCIMKARDRKFLKFKVI